MGCWLGLRALKSLYFNSSKVKKRQKNERFLQRILKEIMKKDNVYFTWNIRRLVNETIVPWTQGLSVLYWRLSSFKLQCHVMKILIQFLHSPKLMKASPKNGHFFPHSNFCCNRRNGFWCWIKKWSMDCYKIVYTPLQ